MADDTIHTETADAAATEVQTEEEKISRSARFYRLHRVAELAKRKAEYAQRPDVIQRREERAKKQAAKEEALRIKQLEKEEKIRHRVEVAERSKASLAAKKTNPPAF